MLSRAIFGHPPTVTPPHSPPHSVGWAPRFCREKRPLPKSLDQGRGWGSPLLFPAQPGQWLSHGSLETQCPYPHNGASLPRSSPLPGTVVQINEITLQMSHPQPRAGSSGCGWKCGGAWWEARLPLPFILHRQAAGRHQPLMKRILSSQPALSLPLQTRALDSSQSSPPWRGTQLSSLSPDQGWKDQELGLISLPSHHSL